MVVVQGAPTTLRDAAGRVYALGHTTARNPSESADVGRVTVRAGDGVTVGDYVAARGHVVDLHPGAPLFFEGDESHSVYVCLAGRIRVFVTLRSGRELVLGNKQPGEAFGELSAIDGRPRAASAAAVGPSRVALMPGGRFLDQLHDEPDLAIDVLRSLTAQLRLANARLRARSGDSALVRCGHMLVELASLKQRHERPPRPPIELDLSQTDIAQWIGATRESTARALAHFRAAGVIRTGRGRIVVSDVPGLARLVASA